MRLIDTHCHIHDITFFTDEEAVKALDGAVSAGVEKVVLIGTSLDDSRNAIDFASRFPDHCRVSIGIHPHEATKLSAADIDIQIKELAKLAKCKEVVAVGECGFDFHYNDRSAALHRQEKLLRGQMDIATESKLPLSFHVRDAFVDFWRVFEDYDGVKGVLHSFTDKEDNLSRALKEGLFIGVNGIATFTQLPWQRELFKSMPLESIVIETDAPFLTPAPKRGKINLPENVTYITNFLAELKGEVADNVANVTSANAKKLFNLN